MLRFLKYFGFIAIIIIVLLLTVPFLIPIANYKETLRSEVYKAIGRELTIDGKINLSLLPKPTFTMHKVKLSSLPNAQFPNLLEVETVKASIALAPLFTGKIVIDYVELNKPQINLEVLNDGTSSWEFSNGVSENTTLNNEKTPNKPFIYPQNFIVKEGQIQYIKNHIITHLDNINLNLNIANMTGPIDFITNFETNGNKFDLEGQIKEVGDIIPITAELKVMGGKVVINGDIDAKAESFKGNIESQGNLKILNIELPKGLLNDYKLSANLYGDKKHLAVDSINLNLGEISVSGQGEYYIEASSGNLNLNLNPGEISVKLDAKSSTSADLESNLELHAKKIKPLLDALEINEQKLPNIITQELSLGTKASYKNGEILLQQIVLSLGDTVLKGVLGIKHTEQKAMFSYDVKTNNGSNFTSLLGIDLPLNLVDVALKGNTTKDGNNIQTNTNIATAKANANVSGNVDITKEIKPSLAVNITGNNLTQTIKQLFETNLTQSLGAFSISTAIDGNMAKALNLALNKATIMIGREDISFKGNTTLNFEGVKPKVISNLQTSTINLDNLMGGSVATNTQAIPKTREAAAATNQSPWSHQKIDLTTLQALDGDLTVSIQRLTKGSLVFDNVNTKMHLEGGILNIVSLKGGLYGGNLESSGVISSQTSQPLSFKVSLQNAQLKNIIPEQNKFKITQGIFNLNMDINSRGDSQYQYVQNLQGKVNFNGADGRLSGVDLQKIVNTLTQIKNLQGALTLLDSSLSGGTTNFKSLKGAFAIDKGVAQLTEFNLLADSATANAIGYIDLPKYWMDVTASLAVQIKNMPPFKARFYGALNNPMHQLDTTALQQYLMQNVLNNVVDNIKAGNNKPEDIIKGILGVGGKNTPAPASAPTNNQNSSNNPVGDLLNKSIKNLLN